MPYANEHAIRLHPPSRYVGFRRKTLAPGIDAIVGFKDGGGSDVQALRFDADKFTPGEARAWAKEHDMSGTLEEATDKFIKIDEAERKVFGYASVSVKDGELVVDLQGDMITPATLEKAAHDFALDSREATAMHEGPCIGMLIETVPLNAEKLASMFGALLIEKHGETKGSDVLTALQAAVGMRWWAGFQLDDETFAKVKDGTYRGFSIEGSADREAA